MCVRLIVVRVLVSVSIQRKYEILAELHCFRKF